MAAEPTKQIFTVEVTVDPNALYTAQELEDALRFQRIGLHHIVATEQFTREAGA